MDRCTALKHAIEDQFREHQKEFSTSNFHSVSKPDIRPYGTAGFRGNSSTIKPIFFNIGIIAGLRCLYLRSNIGIMITASHNPVEDNGVKLIDSKGEMLDTEWEKIVEDFCNIHQIDSLIEALQSILTKFNIDLTDETVLTSKRNKIILGMDTRPSSDALALSVKRGIEAWAPYIDCLDYHILSTPALHYIVAESNYVETKERNRHMKLIPIQKYYDQLVSTITKSRIMNFDKDFKFYFTNELVVDCANGVGCETMRYLCNNEKFNKYLQPRLINTYDGILNRECGADFVKTTLKKPLQANDTAVRYASLDGDADRLVYFYLDEDENDLKLKLLDGDKILCLFSLYLKEQLEKCKQDLQGAFELKMAAIQTAYANGASTDYLTKQLNLNVDFVRTGVKNLHHQAQNYDLAVYFEANGHGTIWISPKARSIIMSNVSRSGDGTGADRDNNNFADLGHLVSTINNYTGDAISDMLLVELILRHYDWDARKWDELYTDRPSSLIRVEVPDRSLIKTSDDDRFCLEPAGLQEAIDEILSNFSSSARCFVRPSGTENVVRIYAETDELESSQRLSKLVGDKLIEVLGVNESMEMEQAT